MNSNLSNEEKKQLSYLRQNAVRNAWKEEKGRVSDGIGTRIWSESEQRELIEKGRVKGYEGHHMKSVSLFPEYAGESKNIQFLSEDEHLYGAHRGDYHNLTNGYYNPETGEMNDFGDELKELPMYDLKSSSLTSTEYNTLRDDYISDQEQDANNDISISEVREEYFNQVSHDKTEQDNSGIGNSESCGMGRR